MSRENNLLTESILLFIHPPKQQENPSLRTKKGSIRNLFTSHKIPTTHRHYSSFNLTKRIEEIQRIKEKKEKFRDLAKKYNFIRKRTYEKKLIRRRKKRTEKTTHLVQFSTKKTIQYK